MNAPALPPGLAELNAVPRHEFLAQMERHPLFMHSLDDGDNKDNPELEALKALAYDGTPQEVALNFKAQGNEAFRERRFHDAREFYSKAIAADSGDALLERALLLNRAAANLELRMSPFRLASLTGENYRDVLRDCGKVLLVDSTNIKALYRSAKACLATEKVDEAEDAIERAISLDSSNAAFHALKSDILRRKNVVQVRNRQLQRKAARERDEQRALATAIKSRDIRIVPTAHPPDLDPIPTYHLSDPADPASELVFPVILLYPLTSQTDLIAEFPLSSNLHEQLSVVLEQSPPWDVHQDYSPDAVDCLMEVERERGRGVIKLGKAAALETAVRGRVIHDGIIRILILPKTKVSAWIAEWKKMNVQES